MDAVRLPPATAELADLLRWKTQRGLELGSPLLEQWFAVGEDQRRLLPLRDQRTGDHVLAVPGGATSTPSSCLSIAATAWCCSGVSSPWNPSGCGA